MSDTDYRRLMAMTHAAGDAIATAKALAQRTDDLSLLRRRLAAQAAVETLQSVAGELTRIAGR